MKIHKSKILWAVMQAYIGRNQRIYNQGMASIIYNGRMFSKKHKVIKIYLCLKLTCMLRKRQYAFPKLSCGSCDKYSISTVSLLISGCSLQEK